MEKNTKYRYTGDFTVEGLTAFATVRGRESMCVCVRWEESVSACVGKGWCASLSPTRPLRGSKLLPYSHIQISKAPSKCLSSSIFSQHLVDTFQKGLETGFPTMVFKPKTP